jgi:hypothetical protein
MLSVRADFANIFNRVILPNPGTTLSFDATGKPVAPPKNSAGQYTSGFGVIPEIFAVGAAPASSNLTANQLPRQGTIVARITF